MIQFELIDCCQHVLSYCNTFNAGHYLNIFFSLVKSLCYACQFLSTTS